MPAAERIVALARHPNVYVKVSALPCYSSEPYPFANLREPLRRVIDAFGPRRAFWGSDITRVPKTCSYRQTVTHFTETLDFLSSDDLAWIMGRGLAECLGWTVQAAVDDRNGRSSTFERNVNSRCQSPLARGRRN